MAEDRSISEGAPDLPLARAALRRRRLRDAALALQLGGVALFVSPFADVFAGTGRVMGLPAGATLTAKPCCMAVATWARMSKKASGSSTVWPSADTSLVPEWACWDRNASI